MLTVRLSENLEHELNNLSEQQHITKSEIVKQAILEYIKANCKTPYETGKDLFGCDENCITDSSITYKQKIRRRIHEKHSH